MRPKTYGYRPGTLYKVWTQAGAVDMANPRGALGIAVTSAEHLEALVTAPSSEDCSHLANAVAAMEDALDPIRNDGSPVVDHHGLARRYL